MIAAWTPPLQRMDVPGPLRAVGAALGPRVAYQGEPGAFGEAAIAQRWEGRAVAVGATTFPRVIGLLLARRVDLALLPTWNSTIGPILGAHELLYDNRTRVDVVDEVALLVRHAVLALPGASLASLRAVGSHHAALGQCARFFAEHPHVTAYEAFDTAGAARELAALVGGAPQGLTPPWYARVPEAAPETLAVIASEAAAQRHGLVVLASAVQDHADNETRFAVLRRHEGGRA